MTAPFLGGMLSHVPTFAKAMAGQASAGHPSVSGVSVLDQGESKDMGGLGGMKKIVTAGRG